MEHPFEVSYLRWIVLLPLLGAAVNGLLGATLQKRFGKNAISLIACSVVGVAFSVQWRRSFTFCVLDRSIAFCWTLSLPRGFILGT